MSPPDRFASHGPIEVKWLWRRVVTIGVLLAGFGLVGAIIWRVTDPGALKWIALGLLVVIALAHTIYLTGATVTDWARVVAAARPGVKIGPASAESAPPEGGAT
jgi:hypothetical protein